MSESTRVWAARIGAPLAFLLAATIAVLIVRSALQEPAPDRPAVPAVATARTYVVKRGDTLGSIARRFGTTVAGLRRLNPELDSPGLPVGRRIRVE